MLPSVRSTIIYFCFNKILRFHGSKVFYSDEFAKDPTFISKEELIDSSDIIVVGVPHSAYEGLIIPDHVEVVDLWGVTKKK